MTCPQVLKWHQGNVLLTGFYNERMDLFILPGSVLAGSAAWIGTPTHGFSRMNWHFTKKSGLTQEAPNTATLQSSCQHQDNDNNQQHTDKTARIITPAPAMRPRRYYAQQSQNQK
jgi:hypothetical protein